jgi:hypothetical protein
LIVGSRDSQRTNLTWRRDAIEERVRMRERAFYGDNFDTGNGVSPGPVIHCRGRCCRHISGLAPGRDPLSDDLMPLLLDGHCSYGSDRGYGTGGVHTVSKLSMYQVLDHLLGLVRSTHR